MRSIYILLAICLCFTFSIVRSQSNDCIKGRFLNNKNTLTVAGDEIGLIGDLDEGGSCFEEPEKGPTWFIFKVCQAGTLTAYIDPEGSADFDFALFDITNGCENKAEIVCNYEVAITDNTTGIGCVNGSSCVPEISVEEGKTYAIMFDRYQLGSTSGFTLYLGGTSVFLDSALYGFNPQVVTTDKDTCGLKAMLEAIPQDGTENHMWNYTGPGTATFSAVNSATTEVEVNMPGLYTFYFNTSRTVCNEVAVKADSVKINFKAIQQPFTGNQVNVCELSENPVNLFTSLLGSPPVNGVWSDDSASGRLDPTGYFLATGLGNRTFDFTYTIPENNECILTTGTVRVFVIGKVTARVDSSVCFGGGSDYRIYSNITGGISGTYRINGTPLTGNQFVSNLLPNNFEYSYTITDASGCGSAVLTGSVHCSCITYAGTLSSNYLVDCDEQAVIALHDDNEKLDGDDVLRYILYSNAEDPLGSIIDTGLTSRFTIHGGLTPGTPYYIAAIAGSKKNNTVDPNDQCLNFSSGVQVTFPDDPVVSLALDTLICAGEPALLKFSATAGAPVIAQLSTNGSPSTISLPAGSSSRTVTPTANTIYQLLSVKDLHGCPGTVGGTATVMVQPRVDLSFVMTTDTIACLAEDADGVVKLKFLFSNYDTVTVEYAVNNVTQAPLTGITNGQEITLPRTTNGKHLLELLSVKPNENACIFPLDLTKINYYYLDTPRVTLSASALEFCNSTGPAVITFTNNEALPVKVKYTVDGAPYEQDVTTTGQFSMNVSGQKKVKLVSAAYLINPACAFEFADSLVLNSYSTPAVVLNTTPKSCYSPGGGTLQINSTPAGVYSLDNINFTANTTITDIAPGSHVLYVKLGETCVFEFNFVIDEIPPYTLTNTLTHTTCNQPNGSIETTVSGFFIAPVTITYNGTSQNTDLAPGIYQVQGTDGNGCVVTVIDTILPSEPFSLTAFAYDSADCLTLEKGSVIAKGLGGNGIVFTYSSDGLVYQTSDTLRNLDPRFYWIYGANDKGCRDSVRIQVLAKQRLQFSLQVMNYLKCYDSKDGSIKVKIGNSGETLVYSMDGINYTPNNVFTNLEPQSYNFFAKETTGCMREEFVNNALTRPAPIEAQIEVIDNPRCWNSNDGFIVMKATGGGNSTYLYTKNNGVTYQASRTFTGLDAGSYSLKVKNELGCESNAINVELTRPDPIEITAVNFVFIDDNTADVTISATGGSPPLQYSLDGTTYQSDSVFDAVPKGEYTVHVRDYKGCIQTKKVLVSGVGLTELTVAGISVYPNPFNDLIRVSFKEPVPCRVEIADLFGRIVKKAEVMGTDELRLSTAELSPGLYTVRITTGRDSYAVKLTRQ